MDVRTDPVLHGLAGFDDTVTPSGCASHASIDASRPSLWVAGSFLLSSFVPVDGPSALRGLRWADGNPIFSVMQTILPPNHPICMNAGSGPGLGSGQHLSGYYGSSSRHQGGCHVLMADGAVRFVTDSIEAGNQSLPQVSSASAISRPGIQSPYGLWGSPGTRASRETIDQGF